MRRLVLFLDDGGVMNENARRGPQWASLAGRYLAPRLGGTADAWRAANAEVALRLFRQQLAYFAAEPDASWGAYWATTEDDWLHGMCGAVGVEAPDPTERQRISRECDLYVTRRVRAAFPGAVGAIRWLRRAGYLLHTASGEPSWELDGYLTGMGVRDYFVGLYGPDQVDVAKASSRYYQLVLAHAGVSPTDALVVDDSEQALDWSAEVGTQTVLCRPDPPTSSRHRHIRSLAELPWFLDDHAHPTQR